MRKSKPGKKSVTKKSAKKSPKINFEKKRINRESVCEELNLGFWEWELGSGKFIFSEKWAETLDYEIDDIPPDSQSIAALFHPDDKTIVANSIVDHIKGKTKKFEFSARLKSKSGEWKWMLALGTTVERDKKGAPVRLAGTHRDISELKMAEELNRMSNDLSMQLAATSTFEVALKFCLDYALKISDADCGGAYIFTDNPPTLQLICSGGDISQEFLEAASKLGASSKSFTIAMQGKPFFVNAETGTTEIRAILMKEGLKGVGMVPIKHNDRIIACINIASRRFDHIPIYAQQAFEALVSPMGSALARIRAEKELLESRSLLNSAIENLPFDLWMVDRSGICIMQNTVSRKNWGDAVGKKMEEISHDKSVYERWRQSINIVLEGEVVKRESFTRGKYLYSLIAPVRHLESVIGVMGINVDITETKLLEQKLKLTQFAMDNSAMPAFWIRPDGGFDYVNRAACELLEYTEEELLKLSALDMYSYCDRGLWNKYWEQIKGKKYKVSESMLQTKSRKSVPVEITSNYIEFEGKEYNFAFAKDISERKVAEDSIRQSEEKFKELAELLPEIVYEMDINGRITFINRNGLAMMGYTEKDFERGIFTKDVVIPDHRERARKSIMNAMVGKPETTNEYTALRKDGTTFPMTVRSSVIVRDGKPAGLRGIIIDITKLKQTEEALAENEQRYRILADNASDIIWTCDLNLRNTYISPSVERLHGWTPEECFNQSPEDMFTPESQQIVLKEFEKYMKLEHGGANDPGFVTTELEYKCKDGSTVWAEVKASFLRNSEGNVIGIYGISRDIADRKHLEDQLRQLAKMDAIGQLAGGIAHDFNNLLTGILGCANLIKLKAEPESRVYDNAKTIEKAAERAGELTAQLLGFARRGKHQIVPVEMHGTIHEVILLFGRTVDKNIKISVDLKAGSAAALGDPAQIQQMLLNLAINARDAMPNGGELTFQTEIAELDENYARTHLDVKPGRYMRVSVTDTGSGIPKEIRNRIFEPFFTTKEKGQGTGMGLAMVYGIVKNHGGHIDLYSEEEVGTTFKIYLPLAQTEAGQKAFSESDISHSGSGCVLLVDDEDIVRDAASSMLQSLGYEVIAASGGKQGIELYKKHKEKIDIVVIDMVMPEIAGKECFKAIKAINPEVRAILSTGYGINGKAQEIIDEGMAGFLQKPYRMAALGATLKEAIGKKMR